MPSIRQLSEADYDAIFELSQFAFQYKLSAEELEKKKQEANRHVIWGWMEQERLAAKVHLIPLACYIHGKIFEMGGISSVATWPEYRRKGMVQRLLKHALEYMRRNGQLISFLHPFYFPFYRKYGWEHCFTDKHYIIPMERLKRKWDGTGYVERSKEDIPLLHTIYTDYAQAFNGMMIRDRTWWEQRVLRENVQIAVAYNEEKQPEGYIIYDVKKEVMNVKEIAYTTINGWKLLLQFIANHDSMAKKVEMIVPESDKLFFLLDEPRFEQKVTPYFMARIVDVFAFLKEYPFAACGQSFTLKLNIEDAFLPDNSGIYYLEHTGEKTNVTFKQEKVPTTETIYCTVQQLAATLIGNNRPNEMTRLGLINGNKEDIYKLDMLIPNKQPYLMDFF